MKTNYLFAFIFIFISINTSSQTLEITSPEEAGFSSTRLERLNKAIQKHVDKKEIPGAITLIARYGKIVNFNSSGVINLETKTTMKQDAIFRIASMTKLITSIAAMILYEEGHYFLNDPVGKYIPELKDMRVAEFDDEGNITSTIPAKSPITIQHLLTHTAGFLYGGLFNGKYKGLDELYAKVNLDMDQQDLHSFVTELSKLPLAFQPGSKWNYGFSTDVLGYLVEKVSGKKLNVFCKERIFDPLGMKDTDFYVPEEKMDRFVTLYNYKNEFPTPVDYPGKTIYDTIPLGCSGGGGLVSTITDYAKIGELLLNKGKSNGIQLLGKKSIELMMMNHLAGISKENWFTPFAGFGFGGAIIEDVALSGEPASKGYFWWAGYYNTYFFVDPVEDMFGILMTQALPFTHLDLMRQFKNLVYQAVVE